MHVEGQFADSYETVQGRIVHRRVDSGNGRLDAPEIVPNRTWNRLQSTRLQNRPNVAGNKSTCKRKPCSTMRMPKRKRTLTNLKRSTARPFTLAGITLSSDSLGVIAKLDLAEANGKHVRPIDYKRGRPRREADGTAGAWPPERVQIALQALVLRDNGYEWRRRNAVLQRNAAARPTCRSMTP